MLSTNASYPRPLTNEDEEKSRKTKMASIIEKYKDRVSTLPKHTSWINQPLYKYEGFWFHQGFWFYSEASFSVEVVMHLQDEFVAQPTNVFLASYPKSGTTWLKALAFAIAKRTMFKGSNQINPLLTTNPHNCVPFIETEAFLTNPCNNDDLLATHLPYSLLPKSIISSDCRIVYICRNPKDVFISFWHFVNEILSEDLSPEMKLEDAFELFSTGVTSNGPCWDHVVGYHKASIERPDKVLFLNYEKMKEDPKSEVKKLATFIGHPFEEGEEGDAEMEEIIKLCSFKKLREVNKTTDGHKNLPNDAYFRKGEVGDSVNYLTPEMIEVLDKITFEKFKGLDIVI